MPETQSTDYQAIRQHIIDVLQQQCQQAISKADNANSDIEFGQLGVDSLTALSLINQLNRVLPYPVAAHELLQFPSVNSLAMHLHATNSNQTSTNETTAQSTSTSTSIKQTFALLAMSSNQSAFKHPTSFPEPNNNGSTPALSASDTQAAWAEIDAIVSRFVAEEQSRRSENTPQKSINVGVITDQSTDSATIVHTLRQHWLTAFDITCQHLAIDARINASQRIRYGLSQFANTTLEECDTEQQCSNPLSLFQPELLLVLLPCSIESTPTTPQSNTEHYQHSQWLLFSTHHHAKLNKCQALAVLSTPSMASDNFKQTQQLGLLLGECLTQPSVGKQRWQTEQCWHLPRQPHNDPSLHSHNYFWQQLAIALQAINQGRLPAGAQQYTEASASNAKTPALTTAQPWQLPPKARVVALNEKNHQASGTLLFAHRKRLGNRTATPAKSSRSDSTQAATPSLIKTATLALIKAAQAHTCPATTPQEIPLFDWSQPTPSQPQMNQSQLGLWLLQQAKLTSTALNVPITLKLQRDANAHAQQQIALLNHALQLLVEQHSVLRSQFSIDPTAQQIDVSLYSASAFSFQALASPHSPNSEESINDDFSHNAMHQVSLPERINTWQHQKRQQSFTLNKEPLLRAYYHHLANETLCFFVIHHTIIDGYSGALFIQQFTQHHQQLSAQANQQKLECSASSIPVTEPTPVTEPNSASKITAMAWHFAARQQEYLTSQTADHNREFWTDYLRDATTKMPLPAAQHSQRSSTQTTKLSLSAELHAQLAQFTRANAVTQPTFFMGALHVFLQLLCDHKDSAFSVVTHGRPTPAFQQTIGCFINVMACRAAANDTKSIIKFLQGFQQRYFNSLQHAQLPFAEQVRCLQATNEAGSMAAQQQVQGKAFNVSFAYQQFFSELTAQQAQTAMAGVQQDAADEYSLEIIEADKKLTIQLKSTRYSEATLHQHLQYFETLLAQMLTAPDQPCRHLRLAKANALTLQHPAQNVQPFSTTSVADAIQQHANTQPQKIAICAHGESITYAQLWQLIVVYSHSLNTQLSTVLAHTENQTSNTSVNIAVIAERRIETIALFIACWQQGVTYVPIAADIAPSRLQHLITDAQLCASVRIDDRIDTASSQQTPNENQTKPRLAEVLLPNAKKSLKQPPVTQPDDTNSIQPTSIGNSLPRSQSNNLAYCLFTSGSTGAPKGVQIPLSAVNHYCWQFMDYFGLNATDKVLQGAALTFDISVEEIFPILCAGGELHVLASGYQDIVNAVRYIQNEGITFVSTVPAICARLAEMPSIGQLRTVISGGDTLKKQDIEELHSKVNQRGQPLRLFNTYGPTETTVCATYHEITADDLSSPNSLPIGKPIANTLLRVVDSQQRPVVAGAVGELWIHGPGLAKGYANQPSLTAKSFVIADGKTWYRTGDFVIYNAQGCVYFNGRKDQQLSIQGFRIEIAEVQQLVQQHASVNQVEIFAVTNDDNTQLAAAIQLITNTSDDKDVNNESNDASKHESHSEKFDPSIFAHLPPYMRPTLATVVATFPLTANDKIDINTLRQQVKPLATLVRPSHGENHTSNANVGNTGDSFTPLNNTERDTFNALRHLWLEQLSHSELADINEQSDWFTLGGHSLNAMRLMMRIEQTLGLVIPIQTLYEQTNLREFTQAVTELNRHQATHQVSTDTLANYRNDADALII